MVTKYENPSFNGGKSTKGEKFSRDDKNKEKIMEVFTLNGALN